MKIFVVESQTAYGPEVEIFYAKSKEEVVKLRGNEAGLFGNTIYELPHPEDHEGSYLVVSP